MSGVGSGAGVLRAEAINPALLADPAGDLVDGHCAGAVEGLQRIVEDGEVSLREEIAQMTTEQWRAWHEMEDAAAFVGSGAAFRSDVFVLLGSIFAMYKTRGTEPHQMLSPEMMALIDRLLA